MTPAEMKEYSRQQEDLLTKKFAASRGQVTGQKNEAMRQAANSYDRLTSRVGGTVGGSIEKAKQESMADLNNKFAETDAGVNAQEAEALGTLKGQQQQMGLQNDQFNKTMSFQKDSFAQQMKYQMKELAENKKTNAVNAMIALKDAGANSGDNWNKLLKFMKDSGYTNLPAKWAPNPEPTGPTVRQAQYVGDGGASYVGQNVPVTQGQ